MKAREEIVRAEIERRIMSVNEQLTLVRKAKAVEMQKKFSSRNIDLLNFLHQEKRVYTSALEALTWALHLLEREPFELSYNEEFKEGRISNDHA